MPLVMTRLDLEATENSRDVIVKNGDKPIYYLEYPLNMSGGWEIHVHSGAEIVSPVILSAKKSMLSSEMIVEGEFNTVATKLTVHGWLIYEFKFTGPDQVEYSWVQDDWYRFNGRSLYRGSDRSERIASFKPTAMLTKSGILEIYEKGSVMTNLIVLTCFVFLTYTFVQ